MNISIVIPTYLRTKDLHRVLGSVFQQSTPVAEVVVVVGPGDAESLAVAEEWQAKHPALVLLQAARPSVVHAINRGLARATGEVICLLDDDVWLPETWADRVASAYAADGQLGAFGGRDRLQLNRPDYDNPPLAKVVGCFQWDGTLQGNHHCGATVSPVGVDVIKGCNLSFRRAAFAAMQVEPALESQGAEVGWEVDICQRIIRAGYRVVYDNEHYVLHYASPRPDYDDRSNLFAAAWGKRTYNESLMTAKYRPWHELVLLGLRSFLIGSRAQPGLVWGGCCWLSTGRGGCWGSLGTTPKFSCRGPRTACACARHWTTKPEGLRLRRTPKRLCIRRSWPLPTRMRTSRRNCRKSRGKPHPLRSAMTAKLVFSHPTGNANVRAAAAGLARAGQLAAFHTAIATFPGQLLDRLGAAGPLAELRRRRFEPGLAPLTHTWPWREAGRLLAGRTGWTALVRPEAGPFSVDAVYQSLDRRVAGSLARAAREGASGVYAYEDGAADAFRAAKKLGLACYYDLPIGYWRAARRLLAPEQTKWPEWAPTLIGFGDSEAKLARKDEELRLADRIFVASRFTADTLRDYPGTLAPVEVIPYGFPAVGENRTYAPATGRPLKVLFVGSLSQRKGVANLFAAVAALAPHVELTVVGHKAGGDCPALDAALARHRWIPSLPHADVLRLMWAHDVLAFPSLFEGFGLVITEAMSQGTPVITTDRTAGPDLIEHGASGWLVEAGSTEALQAALAELLHRPAAVAEAGRAAQEAARRRPWAVYGQELAAALAR